MPAELSVALGVFLTCLGVLTANPMFPRVNRPEIFRGQWGGLFFGAVTFFIFLGGLSTLIWSFLNVTWYVSLLVLIAAFLCLGAADSVSAFATYRIGFFPDRGCYRALCATLPRMVQLTAAPNSAAESDAFRAALNAPSHSAPRRGR